MKINTISYVKIFYSLTLNEIKIKLKIKIKFECLKILDAVEGCRGLFKEVLQWLVKQ